MPDLSDDDLSEIERYNHATALDLDLMIAEIRRSRAQTPRENQKSISAWAERTFGPVGSNFSCYARAQKEMNELRLKLSADDNHPGAVEECADVIIVLLRLVDRMGGDASAAIDAKMAKNRARDWILDGKGHGQHRRDDER